MYGRVLDRNEGLDPEIEITRHPVGRGDEDLGFGRGQAMARAETDDPRMLEVPADDAADDDIVGKPRNSRPQATDAADDEHDGNARLRGAIERVDDVSIDERVHLRPDRGFAAGPRMGDFGLDAFEHALANAGRRDRELLEMLGAGIAGDEVEEPRRVAAERRIAGKEAQIGIDARRD